MGKGKEGGKKSADDSGFLGHSSFSSPSTCLEKFEEHCWKSFKCALYFLDWKGKTRTKKWDTFLDLPFTAKEETEQKREFLTEAD